MDRTYCFNNEEDTWKASNNVQKVKVDNMDKKVKEASKGNKG